MASPDNKRRSFKQMRTSNNLKMTNNSLCKTALLLGATLLICAGLNGSKAIGLTKDSAQISKLCSREGSGSVIVSNRQYAKD